MKIYIFRHAQKKRDLTVNPDLTDSGHAQAKKILEAVERQKLPTPDAIWVSPKCRTHSTMRPVSEKLNIPLDIHDHLEEQQSHESIDQFRSRIQAVLEKLPQHPHKTVFMCTHYDWLAEAMPLIPSDKDLLDYDFQQWAPAQHIGFELNSDGIFQFIELKRIDL